MAKVLAFTRNRHRSVVYNEGESLRTGVETVEAGRRVNGAASAPRGGARTPQSTAAAIVASIVVPTCGRPELLNRCVASLVLQDFDPARFEIIVVDDRPSAETRAIVERWAQHAEGNGATVIYIANNGTHGPAAARNRGWQAARGDIIAFTDDDTIAAPDWLESGLRVFRDDVQAVCGRVIMPLTGTPTDYELDAKNLETAEFVTANCFCRKRILEEIGGFDEQFRFAWREDSDLHFRLLEKQARIAQAPRAVITHPVRPAGWGVSLKQLKKMQFDALLFKKHPARYRERIRATPRWDYYFIVTMLLAAIIGIITDHTNVAAICGGIWLLLTARFSLQRLAKTSKSFSHVMEMIVTSALIPPVAVFWRAVGALRFRVGFL